MRFFEQKLLIGYQHVNNLAISSCPANFLIVRSVPGGLATTGPLPDVMRLQVVIRNQKGLLRLAGSELIPKRHPQTGSLRPQVREQQYVSDRRNVGEQHH